MLKGIRNKVKKIIRRNRKPVIVIKSGENPWRRDKLVRVTVPNIYKIVASLIVVGGLMTACTTSQPQPSAPTSATIQVVVPTTQTATEAMQSTQAAQITGEVQVTELGAGVEVAPGNQSTEASSTESGAVSTGASGTQAVQNGGPGVMDTLDPIMTAVDSSVTKLSQSLNINAVDIQILSAEPMEWPDACLGLPAQGETCAQVVTPGYLVTLEVNGTQYEFHTDQTGMQVRQK